MRLDAKSAKWVQNICNIFEQQYFGIYKVCYGISSKTG